MFSISNSKGSLDGAGSKPKALYEISIDVIVEEYSSLSSQLCIFPPHIYFDILYGLYRNNHHSGLLKELSILKNFTKAIKVSSKRLRLHECFQCIMNLGYFHVESTKPSCHLAEQFNQKCVHQGSVQGNINHLISQGFCVSTFLSEAGWFVEAASILMNCESLLSNSKDPEDWLKLLNCYQRLLHVQNGFYQFKAAEDTFQKALELCPKLQALGYSLNLSTLFSEISTFYMLRSDYSQAYEWSVKSVLELKSDMSPAEIVDVLRQASKSCVLKREFQRAGFLIKQSFKISRGFIGSGNLKYADVLVDFGFYLLNVDAISQGVEVYKEALNVRHVVFGQGSRNFHLAAAHEGLSYALYVYNYSNGDFQEARNHAEKAISLFMCLLPKNHLLLTSCKRVKALILEELAIENTSAEIEAKYLKEAHSLHTDALQCALEVFGEMNVQTAKHYGNLGRLYQSMKDFKKAEKMHLKAIHIKESFLGPDDYEVALSVGHLASLYNYDLGYYSKAEGLYLRSIHIEKKLFGEAFSGLEYDYRGLLQVYANQYDLEKRLHYFNILNDFNEMRERVKENTLSPFSDQHEPLTVQLTIQQFLAL